MTTPENDELLAALEGTHWLTAAERIDSALRPALLVNVFAGTIATAVLAMLVAILTPATLDDMRPLPVKIVLSLAVFAAVALLARWSGVVRYVIDADSLRAEAGLRARSWSIARADIARARVRPGTFAWVLTLSRHDGTERVLALPTSMRRTLGLEDVAWAVGGRPPNKGMNQTRR